MKKIPRRDRCWLLGRRAARLNDVQARHAWALLAVELEALGEHDMPKYRDLVIAIRKATIIGRRYGERADALLNSVKPHPSENHR